MTVDRDLWVRAARLSIARHEAMPAARRRYLPRPATVHVPPAVLLELLGETVEGQLPAPKRARKKR